MIVFLPVLPSRLNDLARDSLLLPPTADPARELDDFYDGPGPLYVFTEFRSIEGGL